MAVFCFFVSRTMLQKVVVTALAAIVLLVNLLTTNYIRTPSRAQVQHYQAVDQLYLVLLVLLAREGRPNATFLACPGNQHGGPAKDYSSRHAAGHKSLPPLLRMLQPGPAAVPVFLR